MGLMRMLLLFPLAGKPRGFCERVLHLAGVVSGAWMVFDVFRRPYVWLGLFRQSAAIELFLRDAFCGRFLMQTF